MQSIEPIMRKTATILLLLPCLWFLASCTSLKDGRLKDSDMTTLKEGAPVWITQKTHPEYTHAFYLSGIGSSDQGSREADDAARMDLLKQIEVEIRGEESAVQTESNQSGEQATTIQSSTHVQTRIDASVHMRVPGLRIVERWTDTVNNRYYSLVVLNREDAAGQLREKILELHTTINGLVKAGEAAEASRDYGIAIRRYEDAVSYAGDLQTFISQYRVIGGETLIPLGDTIENENRPPLTGGDKGVGGHKAFSGETPISMWLTKGHEDPSTHRVEGKGEEGFSIELKDPPDIVESVPLVSLADLKIKIVRLAGKVPRTLELLDWEDGIRDLVLQIISRLPSEGVLTVKVGDFSEGRSGNRVPLSNLLESDIRTTLVQVEDISVLDMDQDNPDMYLTGLFRIDEGALRVNVTMKDTETGAIVTAGRVLINAGEISMKDLQPHSSTPDRSPHAPPYNIAVEQILTLEDESAPLNLTVWTDKSKFRIGEPVILYFRADRDCYITILDQGTSGTLRVLFPNPYQRDNFLRADKTYTVPDPAAGYEIRVDGPPGIERIKAIATLEESAQLHVDVSEGFYELDPQDGNRMRDLTLIREKLAEHQWAQDYIEIDISTPGGLESAGQRKIKPKRPEKPVDIIGTPGAIDTGRPRAIEPKEPEKPVDILGVPGVKKDE